MSVDIDGVATAGTAAGGQLAEPVDGPVADPTIARVPDRLFDEDEAEQRWRERFSAVRISLPDPARDAPERAVYTSNETGRYELYTWDVASGRRTMATSRPDGTTHGQLSPDGSDLWWFDDADGNEFGSWRAQPFGSGPDQAGAALPGVPPGYPAGLEVGESLVLIGFSDDDGSRIHLRRGEHTGVIYQHTEDAGVGALSRDESIWILAHSEHGDSRYPALRALSTADGSLLGALDDTPGQGLSPITFSPVPGDQRLLVGHERRGRDELLIWDVASGAVSELAIDLPGDLEADFYPDGSALVVLSTHAGRTTMHRFSLTDHQLTALPAAPGVISGAVARPDGSVWYRWSSAAAAGRSRALSADGAGDSELLLPPGGPAPDSLPLNDFWVDGPGGSIHALLARPSGYPVPEDGLSGAALPTVFFIHGGPVGQDDDSYNATRAAWLDAGFAVAHVNYRGSSGYGSAWRDALTERIGHTELADIGAVHDHLVAVGLVDESRSVVAGYSWGGFLTLLALGTQPDRWVAGVAGVPVADYITAYAEEMEPLRAYDRALFGGSPEEKPEAYTDSSPLTHIDRVAAPVLILAGENDPRCPIGQINNYVAVLKARGMPFAQYRYEAGHGSMVVEERIRQVRCEIDFVRRVLGERSPSAPADAPPSG